MRAASPSPRPRQLIAVILVAGVSLFALAFFPPLLAIPVYAVAPAAAALLVAGGSRENYVACGLAGAMTGGLVSGAWILALADASVVSLIIGAIASFLILSVVAAFVCYLVGRAIFHNAA